LSKTNPKTDAYIHDFLATLDPKDAEKYGAYVKRRFYQESFNPEWSTFTWDEFARLTAALGGKRFQTLQEYQHTFQKAKFRATGGVWNSWYMASKLVDTVICLDGATGKELWKKAFPLPGTWEGVAGGETLGPATTPAVWASKCYVGGQLGLYCLSAKDGALLWQKTGHGCHGSPLVADSVVVYGGGYDAETGKLLWGQGVGCGHSSPVLWTCAGKSYAICGGTCLDLHTGKTLWSVKCDFGYGTTPVINGDTLVANSGAYKLTPDKAELLWKMPTGVADPASTPVVHQDHLYVFHSWYDEPFWYCLDMKTGQVKWKQKTVLPADDPCSSLVLADGKIIHAIGLGHAGETFRVELVRATPEEFAQLGAFDPKAAPMSSPAVAGGRLYLRLWDSVACYDLTGKR
jgi:outer membrane protein assembly factor BamB